MAGQLAWFREQPDEYAALDLQTGAVGFGGERRRSQKLACKAVDSATRSGAFEIAAQYAAEQALRIVFWSPGPAEERLPSANDRRLRREVRAQTQTSLGLVRNKLTLSRAALALALAGQTPEAELLIKELKAEYPKDALINGLWLPVTGAALALQNNKPEETIELLETAERFEPAAEFYPQYLRGLAYLKLNKTEQAVSEFEKILDHRGQAPLSAVYPLAQLESARAKKNKNEYEKFFKMWPNADKDMPSLIAARKEMRK
jgi:tetratricopeptide (TPR) repeat protein